MCRMTCDDCRDEHQKGVDAARRITVEVKGLVTTSTLPSGMTASLMERGAVYITTAFEGDFQRVFKVDVKVYEVDLG